MLLVLCITVLLFIADARQCYAAESRSGQCGDSLYWSLDSNGVMTITGTGKMWDFRNDAQEFDYHACPWGNYKSQIKKVKFASGITYVGADAFSFCTEMTNVEFSNTIETIGCFAFMGCEKLQNFTLPDSLLTLRQQCFDCCNSLTRFVIPDSVTFPDVEIVNNCSSITYLYIGKNAGRVVYGMNFIGDCPALEKISVSEDSIAFISIDGVLYDRRHNQLIQYPSGKKDTVYTVQDGTVCIGQMAFIGTKYLQKIIIPESVTDIGTYMVFSSSKPIEVDVLGDNTNMAMSSFSEFNLTVRCNYNSKVWKYCVDNNVHHVCFEHVWGAGKKVAPTEDSLGYTEYCCEHCDETKRTDYVKFLASPQISSVQNTNDGIRLNVKAVDGATGYYIYRKTATSGWTNIGTISANTLSYTDSNAVSGYTYIYTVRAYNTQIVSGFDHAGKTIKRLAQPGVTSVYNDTTGITVKWNKINGATAYNLYRRTATTSWVKIATISNGSTLQYTDRKAASGCSYLYTFRAVSGNNISSYNSKATTVKRLAQPSLAVANAQAGIYIKWSKTAGASGYYLYRKTSNTSWKVVATITNPSTITYTDKTAKAGTTYTYTVRAFSGSCLSNYNHAGITTRRLAQPSLSAARTSTGINVKWSKVTGSSAYYVYRKTAGGSWSKIVTVKSGNSISYLDKTARKGVTYYYTVRAVYGNYISSYMTSGVAARR